MHYTSIVNDTSKAKKQLSSKYTLLKSPRSYFINKIEKKIQNRSYINKILKKTA